MLMFVVLQVISIFKASKVKYRVRARPKGSIDEPRER